MKRNLVYVAFVLLAAVLLYWVTTDEAAPPGDVWDRPGGPVTPLVLPAEPWGPFADVVLRAEATLGLLPASLAAPGCELVAEELRVVSGWSPEGRLQVALAAADPSGIPACPAVELLLRPGGSESPMRVQVRALSGGPDRGVLRNLRGRVSVPELPWDGELPLPVSLRLQGEDAARAPVTLDATFTLLEELVDVPRPAGR